MLGIGTIKSVVSLESESSSSTLLLNPITVRGFLNDKGLDDSKLFLINEGSDGNI